MVRASVRAVRKSDIKTKLRSFLDANEPRLASMVHRLHHNQSNAITYKELREAILSGEFENDGIISGGYAERWLNNWRQDYSRFVIKYLLPEWEKGIKAGAEEIRDKRPGWYFNPAEPGVREWTRTHGAAFVTNSTQTQIDALRAVIRRAATSDMHGMSVDKLARVVRPMVGLTIQQTAANIKYYNSLIAGGMSEKKALELSIKYGERQHRYRGYNIARTELAFAYNRGAFAGVKQAQRLGLMGKVVKRWVVAEDERTCQECSALSGALIDLDAEFDFYTRLTEPGIKLMPPAHPSCRCTVEFEEVEPAANLFEEDPESYGRIVGFIDEEGKQFDYIQEVKPAPQSSIVEIEEVEDMGLPPAEWYDIIEEIPIKTPKIEGAKRYSYEELAELLRDYNKSRANNMISAFTTFDDYVHYKERIQNEIVGLTTSDGIIITGQTKHFIERIFGTTEDPHTGRPRSGVEIEDVIYTLSHPQRIKLREKEECIVYMSDKCVVSVNSKTHILIQTSPKS